MSEPLCLEIIASRPDLTVKAAALSATIARELDNINQGPLHLVNYADFPTIKPHYAALHTIYRELCADLNVADLTALVPRLDLSIPSGSDLDRAIAGLITIDVSGKRRRIDYYAELADGLMPKSKTKLTAGRYGLVAVDPSFKLHSQGIILGSELVYYHPFLRRFYSARFVDVPDLLERIRTRGKSTLELALDPMRLTLAQYLDRTMEFDYWYGIHFDESRLDDPKYKGVIVHGRSDPAGVLDLTFPVVKTIFYVSDYSNGEKEFQVEELVPTDSRVSSDEKYTLHRFAHFIWDPKQRHFRHFDVAALIYDKSQHAKRLKYDWKSATEAGYAEAFKRKKLFRLDGEITVAELKDLLFAFFRYNELVMEYFGAVPEGMEATTQK